MCVRYSVLGCTYDDMCVGVQHAKILDHMQRELEDLRQQLKRYQDGIQVFYICIVCVTILMYMYVCVYVCTYEVYIV